MSNALWPLVHAERAAVIADLSGLDAERWNAKSLGAGLAGARSGPPERSLVECCDLWVAPRAQEPAPGPTCPPPGRPPRGAGSARTIKVADAPGWIAFPGAAQGQLRRTVTKAFRAEHAEAR